MIKANKQQIAGYGLHYYANNYLFSNLADRTIFQCLIDLVRKQLNNSLDNQTVIISARKLGKLTNTNMNRTVSASLSRLEKLGLIKKYKNGILINCDEYVALIKIFESLGESEKVKFIEDFNLQGTNVIGKYSDVAFVQYRTELLQQSGSSITINSEKCCKSASLNDNEPQNDAEVHHSEEEDVKCCRSASFDNSEVENDAEVHHSTTLNSNNNDAEVHHFLESIVNMIHNCNIYYTIEELKKSLGDALLHHFDKSDIEEIYYAGNITENMRQKCCTSASSSDALLHHFLEKVMHFCSTVIIYNINKKIKGEKLSKNKIEQEENSQENIKKGFESFETVEVLDLSKGQEDFKQAEVIEDISQLKLKRAERSLRERNIYRNKPFIKFSKIKDIVECLDEVVQSPVDFFLYQFWWGVYDLYCDHYHPSVRIDEEGEIIDEPQSDDWKEMIGAAIPQDEVYSLALNVYEDLVGAVEQGKYVYGENNEWEIKFQFKSFEDFSPCEMFQWKPCTMQDKSVLALEVAIDRFYDIEAPDITIPTTTDKNTKNLQNKQLIQLIMETEDSSVLTPMESAIKLFYDTFVKMGDDYVIDYFVDAKGNELECCGRLPDYIFKVWCYDLPSIRYTEFTNMFNSKYKPIDGVHRKAYIFSAELVTEWNERNGFFDTISHRSLKVNQAE